MATAVLDASAILALLRNEAGAEQVGELIADALVSTVNEAEVISKLIWRGETPERALLIAATLPYQVVGLDRQLAQRAGALWAETKPQGLSLGDRCCIALAERERLPAITTDTQWAKVTTGVDIKVLSRRRRR